MTRMEYWAGQALNALITHQLKRFDSPLQEGWLQNEFRDRISREAFLMAVHLNDEFEMYGITLEESCKNDEAPPIE